MPAYYNEFDPSAAAWLRELIKRGLIADGEVDERSILDIRPVDLAGFTQCHFFAGIGGWSHALRLAGVRDDYPVWTGSPPCQPFSSAGRQLGRDDCRHLAPHFIGLVAACRPGLLFGEQVASAGVFGKAASGAGRKAASAPDWAWFDDLSDRLEAAHYAVGASDIPAAGVGAPHIRQRTFFGAVRLVDAERARLEGWRGPERGFVWSDGQADARGAGGGLADTDCERHDGIDALLRQGQIHSAEAARSGETSGLADAERQQCEECLSRAGQGDCTQGSWPSVEPSGLRCNSRSDAADVPWGTADWLFCRDGKWRAVEPGTFPLAHGIPARVGRLRGYGNAIVPQAAAEFIRAFIEVIRQVKEELDAYQN